MNYLRETSNNKGLITLECNELMQTNISSQHPCRNEEGKLTTSQSIATPGDSKKKQHEPTRQAKTWTKKNYTWLIPESPSNPSSWNSYMQWNIWSYPPLTNTYIYPYAYTVQVMSHGYCEPKYDTIWSTVRRTTKNVKTHFLK